MGGEGRKNRIDMTATAVAESMMMTQAVICKILSVMTKSLLHGMKRRVPPRNG